MAKTPKANTYTVKVVMIKVGCVRCSWHFHSTRWHIGNHTAFVLAQQPQLVALPASQASKHSITPTAWQATTHNSPQVICSYLWIPGNVGSATLPTPNTTLYSKRQHAPTQSKRPHSQRDNNLPGSRSHLCQSRHTTISQSVNTQAPTAIWPHTALQWLIPSQLGMQQGTKQYSTTQYNTRRLRRSKHTDNPERPAGNLSGRRATWEHHSVWGCCPVAQSVKLL